MKNKTQKTEYVIREGEPVAVIVDIHVYQEMLEKLEDIEDLKMLSKIRKTPLKFKKFDDFLVEHNLDV